MSRSFLSPAWWPPDRLAVWHCLGPDPGRSRLRHVLRRSPASEKAPPTKEEPVYPEAPELTGGVAWLNTDKPIKLKDLRGKIVVLDFWTLCCINCIHTLPELAKLEKKYPNELVVIGVHTAKFDNEKDTESIRKAVLRYQVTHPVVNDADQKIWRSYGAQSWPTLRADRPRGQGRLVRQRRGRLRRPRQGNRQTRRTS